MIAHHGIGPKDLSLDGVFLLKRAGIRGTRAEPELKSPTSSKGRKWKSELRVRARPQSWISVKEEKIEFKVRWCPGQRTVSVLGGVLLFTILLFRLCSLWCAVGLKVQGQGWPPPISPGLWLSVFVKLFLEWDYRTRRFDSWYQPPVALSKMVLISPAMSHVWAYLGVWRYRVTGKGVPRMSLATLYL